MQTSKASETWGDGIYFYVRKIAVFILNLWSLVQLTEGHGCVVKNHLKPWAHLEGEQRLPKRKSREKTKEQKSALPYFLQHSLVPKPRLRFL